MGSLSAQCGGSRGGDAAVSHCERVQTFAPNGGRSNGYSPFMLPALALNAPTSGCDRRGARRFVGFDVARCAAAATLGHPAASVGIDSEVAGTS